MKLGKIGFMGVDRRGRKREIGKAGGRKSQIIAVVGRSEEKEEEKKEVLAGR